MINFFFFSSRRRHTRWPRDWSSDVCSSDLTYYRRRWPQRALPARARSPRALSVGEQATVLDVLHEPRFVDLAPAEVYATLLDEGAYLCSERTMYRLLAEHAEVRERRDQLRHPTYAAPEL